MDKNTLQTQRQQQEQEAAAQAAAGEAPSGDQPQNPQNPASPENNADEDQPQSPISEESVSQQGGEAEFLQAQKDAAEILTTGALRVTAALEAIRDQLMGLDILEANQDRISDRLLKLEERLDKHASIASGFADRLRVLADLVGSVGRDGDRILVGIVKLQNEICSAPGLSTQLKDHSQALTICIDKLRGQEPRSLYIEKELERLGRAFDLLDRDITGGQRLADPKNNILDRMATITNCLAKLQDTLDDQGREIDDVVAAIMQRVESDKAKTPEAG